MSYILLLYYLVIPSLYYYIPILSTSLWSYHSLILWSNCSIIHSFDLYILLQLLYYHIIMFILLYYDPNHRTWTAVSDSAASMPRIRGAVLAHTRWEGAACVNVAVVTAFYPSLPSGMNEFDQDETGYGGAFLSKCLPWLTAVGYN